LDCSHSTKAEQNSEILWQDYFEVAEEEEEEK
jgi:hypothetical protein